MKIQARSKPRCLAGSQENYKFIKVCRRCGSSLCPGRYEKPISPPDPPALTGFTLDLEVQARICEMRWKDRNTEAEIVDRLRRENGIIITEGTVGNVLRLYEIGCSQKYKPEIVEKIKANRGIILTIDAMEPLKGEPAVYMGRDEISGLVIHAKQLRNKKELTIEKFLLDVKIRVETALKVPVLGIVCDAQKEIVHMVEKVFPGIPICLCDYHFYKLVLKAPLEADSGLLTKIRSLLRNISVLKDYKSREVASTKTGNELGLVDDILDTLVALSNWTRKPRDPCFTGLELRSRVVDMLGVIREVHSEAGNGILSSKEEKTIKRLEEILDACIAKTRHVASGLERVKEYLAVIVSILDADNESKEGGMRRMEAFKVELEQKVGGSKNTKFEKEFAKAFGKYVDTKGERLFNYRMVKGAPKTNNHHELKHMAVKHQLRRTIGHSAASYYLLMHGECMVFVNPDESLENIKVILRDMDVEAAKKIIASERKPRTATSIIMHVADKWKEKMARLRAKLAKLKRANTITS